MANRFVSPQQQFISYAGRPYAGGLLYFYFSGTSVPTPTYQDEALSIPNTNPVVLDSAGDAGNIFLDPGITYKVKLTDSSNNPIWTFDPVIPTDSNTGSGFEPIVSCTAAGTNSITLTPITPSQQPAAYSNYQVFAFVPVSTTTGAVSAQVGSLPSESVYVAPGVQAGSGTFVANDGPYYIGYGSLVGGSGPGFLLLNQNLGGIQSSLPLTAPQGYLTLTSQTPVIPTDVVGSTNVFWTPLIGLGCPVHNGVSIVSAILSGELSLALTSAQVASNIYDVYLAYNGGTPVIGTGPSWAAGSGGSITAGSCARGTGTGGAALIRTQGIWTNAAAISLTYNLGGGNISLAVPANQGVYLGSIFIDATAGQVSAYRSAGQNRKWGIWNAYNRQPIALQVQDPSASYTQNNNVWEATRTTANSLTVFAGLPEESVDAEYLQLVGASSNSTAANPSISMGLNQTTAPNASIGSLSFTYPAAAQQIFATIKSTMVVSPLLGISSITCLSNVDYLGASTVAPTYWGGQNMAMTAWYKG